MYVDVSRAYFHAKAQRLVLVRLPVEDGVGADARKIGLLKKSMYGTRDAASNWECDWEEHVKEQSVSSFDSARRTCSIKKGHQVAGMTHGDDFVLTGPTERLAEFKM